MTRPEAGNLLMVGAGLISALHTGLFAVWISALGLNGHESIPYFVSLFGLVFIILNAAFWMASRQMFQKELRKNSNSELLNPWMSAGLMIPYAFIIMGWLLALNYSHNL